MAERRNRRIGRPGHGRGRDNAHVVPDTFWRWSHDRSEIRSAVVGCTRMTILIDRLLPGHVHACSVADVLDVLRRLPPADWGERFGVTGIRGIVFRQPTRRKERLRPTWGSVRYWLRYGPIDGPTIVLDAQPDPLELNWPHSLTIEDRHEFNRLAGDAESMESSRRAHHMHFRRAGIRRLQLTRTLPHEVGHFVDFRQSVLFPRVFGEAESDELERRYWRRPDREREEFAHRYAAEANVWINPTELA